jgi:hypothetical protein
MAAATIGIIVGVVGGVAVLAGASQQLPCIKRVPPPCAYVWWA